MTYFADYAWLGDRPQRDVRIETSAGRITAVRPGARREPEDRHLRGLTLPGFANTHSHAFHRALRGSTHAAGTFWSWREQMYGIAARLDPDSYLDLARATFAEMALAGIATVGEFHYLHHAPGGVPYSDPNAMGHAMIQAARDAGVRITLLDTCYLSGGLGLDGPVPLTPEQARFGDGDADRWAARVAALGAGLTHAPHARLGAAVHSVRAVPRAQLPTVVEAARGRPLHFHLSEQAAENEQCMRHYGMTPTALLAAAGALGPSATAVHATHLSATDVAELGASATWIAMCPTTERDLADGIGPARALRDAGCPITLGSDQHAVIDLLEEARALEMDERLASGQRGCFEPAELVAALTRNGQRSLGWNDAGEIADGMRADLTTIALDSVRTAGCAVDQAMLAATASDVHSVVVDGRVIVSGGEHVLGDAASLFGFSATT